MVAEPNFDAMVKSQREKSGHTRDRVLAVLRIIEAEIAEHGSYPHNDGKVTLIEVVRRASVGATTLRNAHHHETRDVVRSWLARLKDGGNPATKSAAQNAKQGKIDWYEEQLKILAAEALKWRLEIEKLETKNRELQDALDFSEAALGKIRGIHGRVSNDD